MKFLSNLTTARTQWSLTATEHGHPFKKKGTKKDTISEPYNNCDIYFFFFPFLSFLWFTLWFLLLLFRSFFFPCSFYYVCCFSEMNTKQHDKKKSYFLFSFFFFPFEFFGTIPACSCRRDIVCSQFTAIFLPLSMKVIAA